MAAYPCRAGYIVALSFCFAVYIANIVINALAGSPHPPLFYNSTGEVSAVYNLDITPAGWAFSIWGIIYTWQFLWFGYAFSTLCRPGIDGYLYYSPTLLPVSIYYIYIVNLVDLCAWLVLWDRSAGSTTYLIPAAVCILLGPVLLITCLVINIRAVSRHLLELYQNGLMREVWLLRYLFQNGLACYATWVTIASLLNLAMVLHYYADAVNLYTAGSISLGVLSAEVLLWFILDIFVLDRYTRYMFVPYCVLVWALSAVVNKNYPVNPDTVEPEGDPYRNPIWSIVLLSVSALFLVVKLAVMIYRHCRYPLPPTRLSLGGGSREDLRGGSTYQGYGSVDPPTLGDNKQKL